ncbi:unnamed protein product [Withania somnifera]
MVGSRCCSLSFLTATALCVQMYIFLVIFLLHGGIFFLSFSLFVDSFTRHVLLVHFWAPTFKWGISIANIADFAKPPEKISYPQQIAVTATGLIWSRYSLVITPKNWNLFSVNVAMAGTGLYQLSRKIRDDYFNEEQQPALAKE